MKRVLPAFFLFLFLPLSMPATEFVVNIWGVPVAYVTLIENIDTTENKKEIIFSTFTRGLIGRLYPLENSYHFWVDMESGGLISFNKKIRQDNLTQDYSENFLNESIHYSTGDSQNFSGTAYHMLTLIVAIQDGYVQKEQIVTVEHEGEFYRGRVTQREHESQSENLQLDIKLSKTGGNKVLEKTDLFSWKLTDESATSFVLLSQEDGKISGAGFSWKNMTLTAYRKK